MQRENLAMLNERLPLTKLPATPSCFFNSNECSEYSDIDLGDFFFRKTFKICSRSILGFRGLTFDFFQFTSFLLFKGRQFLLSNIKNVKVTKNVIDF